jgi:peptidoglycan/LPS O-acetylase OafA/YrhL
MALGAVSVALSGTEPGPARLFVRRLPWLPWLAAVALYVLIGELPSIISPAHRMLLWLGAKQLRCLLAVLVMLPLVCGAGNGDRFRAAVGSRVPRFLNTVCFGLYLWHVPVLLVLDDLHVRGAVGWLAYSALAALFSVALATVSWYAIEQPSQTAAKRWWARRRRPVEVPAAEVEAPVPAAMQW